MDSRKVGALIAERRKEKGLTQKELGRRLHVSDRAVSKWERGLNLPDAALFEPLCRELDITVTELLRGEREEPTTAQLEQTVCDAVALAGEKERRARRNLRSALGLLAVNLCLGLLVLAVFLPGLLWGSGQRFSSFVDRLTLPDIPVLPVVELYYPDTREDASYAARTYVELYPGGGRGTYFFAGDGQLREENGPLMVTAPEDSQTHRGLYILSLTDEKEVTFRLEGKGMERGRYEVNVYRYPQDRLGEENLTLEDGWPVLFWDSPRRDGEHRDTMYFQATPGYYYTVVLSWGEGNFVEFPFLTEPYE